MSRLYQDTKIVAEGLVDPELCFDHVEGSFDIRAFVIMLQVNI